MKNKRNSPEEKEEGERAFQARGQELQGMCHWSPGAKGLTKVTWWLEPWQGFWTLSSGRGERY